MHDQNSTIRRLSWQGRSILMATPFCWPFRIKLGYTASSSPNSNSLQSSTSSAARTSYTVTVDNWQPADTARPPTHVSLSSTCCAQLKSALSRSRRSRDSSCGMKWMMNWWCQLKPTQSKYTRSPKPLRRITSRYPKTLHR